jgi:hypothetical protein
MRKKTTPHIVSRWHKHVARVQSELKNASAPPPWWNRMWAWIIGQPLALWHEARSYYAPEAVFVPAPAPPVTPHVGECDHKKAKGTTLGTLIKSPKPADRVLFNIKAWTCPTCGMTTACLR